MAARPRPGVGAGHDRLRLAQERVRSGLLGHGADNTFQRRIAKTVAVDEDRKQAVGDFGKAAGLGEFDQRQAGRGLRRNFAADASSRMASFATRSGAWRTISNAM